MTDALAIFDASKVFASEVDEAKKLGFILEVGYGRKGVRAGLFPRSSGARAACRAINAMYFESRCEVPEGANAVDALRDTIHACLEHAKQAMA